MLVACAGLVASLISNYFSLVLILQVLRLTERAQEEGHEQANPYKVALRKFIPLLLLSLMLLLGIGMGIVLFIIPGIYLLLRLMFAQYTFLASNRGAFLHTGGRTSRSLWIDPTRGDYSRARADLHSTPRHSLPSNLLPLFTRHSNRAD